MNSMRYLLVLLAAFLLVGNAGAILYSNIGVWRDSTHQFYVDFYPNGVWQGAAIDRAYNFGMTGDLPVTGDWNHDGLTEIGVFRPSTHLFYLDLSRDGTWNGPTTDRVYNFGMTGDIPVNGDWNNDGNTEIGVFRPLTHMFYLDYNGNGVWNGPSTDRRYDFGITGDIPVVGDWNGDVKAEIGVYRPSTHLFYLDNTGNGAWDGAGPDYRFSFGMTGDLPVSGEWNHAGGWDIGVFRPSTHLFYLDYNGDRTWSGPTTDRRYDFGIGGDTPVAGEWDH